MAFMLECGLSYVSRLPCRIGPAFPEDAGAEFHEAAVSGVVVSVGTLEVGDGEGRFDVVGAHYRVSRV